MLTIAQQDLDRPKAGAKRACTAPPVAPLPCKLNSLQRTMLQWNSMHPYNAVHVVRIPHVLDLDRLTEVINGTLETLGLTGLALDSEAGTFHYRGGPALCEIKTLTADANPF